MEIKDMKSAIAEWCCTLDVECPYCECDQEINIQEIDDIGAIRGFRAPESASDIGYIYRCIECDREFKIDETCW